MITVYSTKTCPWCTKVKEYLEGKKYRLVIDVASDRKRPWAVKNRADGRSGDEDEEKYIVGYNPEAIDEEIAQQNQ